MPRRTPAEYYAKYLICLGKTDAELEAEFNRLNLHLPSKKYWQILRDSIQVPKPFFPKVRTHVPTVRFLRQHRIEEVSVGTERMVETFKLFERPDIREAIEALKISGAPSERLVEMIYDWYGYKLLKEVLDLYFHYFFNTRLISRTELREALGGRESKALVVTSGMSKAVIRASYQDPRRLAALLPVSPMSTASVALRLGFSPAGYDASKMLPVVRDTAIIKANESLHLGGKEGADTSYRMMLTAKMADELYGNIGRPESELTNQMRALKLTYEPTDIPHVDHVTHGNYSSDFSTVTTVGVEVQDDSGKGNPSGSSE